MAKRDYFRRAQQRRYQTRSYRNPHLSDRKTPNVKVLLLSSLGTVVVIALFVFLLAHPWFKLTNVQVTGVEYLDRANLEQTLQSYVSQNRYLFFHRSNRFLFTPEELAQVLTGTFALASVDVSTQEGVIYVSLEERTSNLFWKTQGKLFVVDLEGVVVREVLDSDDSILQQSNIGELPIFIDKNSVSVEIGSFVLKPEEVEAAFQFFTLLSGRGILHEYIEVDRVAGKWVKIVTKQGFDILCDLSGDMENQFRNLATILDEQVEDPSELEYIDLRFGDKVYYK